MLQEAFSIA